MMPSDETSNVGQIPPIIHEKAIALSARRGAVSLGDTAPHSTVKPTLMVTCQWATWFFSMSPRVSMTWNQRRFFTVLPRA